MVSCPLLCRLCLRNGSTYNDVLMVFDLFHSPFIILNDKVHSFLMLGINETDISLSEMLLILFVGLT